MNVIKIKELGLAAFIKINGGTLVSFEGRDFSFESDKTVDQWRVLYYNSCCYKHDNELLQLRKFLGVSQ